MGNICYVGPHKERQQTHGLFMGSKSSRYATESVYQLQEEILMSFLFE